MVYKRYIKQNGKSFGPYYYSSQRKGKKVVSKYLPEYGEEKSSLFSIFALGFVFLFIISMFLIIGVDYNQYNKDAKIIGKVISDIPNINNSIYEFLSPWILLILFFLVLLFLGYSIIKMNNKNKIKRLTDMSYLYGKEETQKMIQKLLSR